MPTLLSTLSPLFRSLHHHCHLVTHHHIHHHIENSGGERVSLHHSSIPLKNCLVITACPCHHCQPPKIIPEEQTFSGNHVVAFQDLKAPGPFQGVNIYARNILLTSTMILTQITYIIISNHLLMNI